MRSKSAKVSGNYVSCGLAAFTFCVAQLLADAQSDDADYASVTLGARYSEGCICGRRLYDGRQQRQRAGRMMMEDHGGMMQMDKR